MAAHCNAELSMGWVNSAVWSVGSGRGSQMAGWLQKTKAFYLLSICLFKYSFKLVADYWSSHNYRLLHNGVSKKGKGFPILDTKRWALS